MIQLRNRYGDCAVSGFISNVCPDTFGLSVAFKSELPSGRAFEGQVMLFQVGGRWRAAVCDEAGPQLTDQPLWTMGDPSKSEMRTVLAFLVESANEGVEPHLETLRAGAWTEEGARRYQEYRSLSDQRALKLKRYKDAVEAGGLTHRVRYDHTC